MNFPILRGYEFCRRGRSEKTQTRHLQVGRNQVHLNPVGLADQQEDYGRCSSNTFGVTLRFCE
jgi:hypothetical protein